MLIKKLTFALMAGCFALTACNKYVAETNKRIEETLSRVEEYQEAAQIPDLPEPNDTVRMQNDIYLGNQSIKIMEGDALPMWLEKEDGITLAVSDDAKLPDVLQEISDITGMNIRLDDLRADNAIPENSVPIKYTGSLSGLLNYLSNRYNVYWRYKDGIISFFTQETRVFTIYALPTETTLSASMSGSSMGENGGGNASSNLSVSTDLKIWESIEEGVKQVVGDNGKLSFSHAAGTVTVTASPYVVRKVAAYINNWNEKLSRQVAITVRVLQVTLNNDDNYGLNLVAAFNTTKKVWSEALNKWVTVPKFNLDFIGPAAGSAVGGSALSMALIDETSKFSGTSGVINALSTQGKVRTVTSASVTTLNNKVAPVQITTSKNYLKEITVTSSGSGEDRTQDTDYEVDTLNYGFTMELLPRILDHGRLILLFNLSLSDLVNMTTVNIGNSSSDSDEEDSSGGETETGTLQLPTMEMRGFAQEIAMRSGQTLVLTGFEKLKEEMATSGVGKAKMGLLGGSAINSTARAVMVILLTPEILQSPLSQEALMRNY